MVIITVCSWTGKPGSFRIKNGGYNTIAERAKKYQPKPKITYKMIQEYVEKKYGFKVHTAYIAEVKRSLGLTMYDAPNAVEELKQSRKHPPKEKVEAIKEARLNKVLDGRK